MGVSGTESEVVRSMRHARQARMLTDDDAERLGAALAERVGRGVRAARHAGDNNSGIAARRDAMRGFISRVEKAVESAI